MARAKIVRNGSPASTNITSIDRKGSVENVAPEGRKATATNGNLEEEIRHRAYELYQKRGGQHGRAQEDWFQAEAEVRGRTSSRSA
jgi:Protein of unknown function (DUF2934)